MNKKVWLGFLATFVVLEILMYLIDGVLLASAYKAIQGVFRPDMNSKMWFFHVVTLFNAFFFAFIFSKGHENKGIMEGVRYGFYIGVWLSVGMALGTDAMIALGRSLTIQWLIYGIIEYVIAGIVLALVFKQKPKEAAA